MSPLLVINFMAMIIPLPPAHSPSSLTYLCDLVEQFVVFLPFLQGAQIAAHSSCQGNSAECPLECVCCLRCVWTPPWAIHTRAPLPWLPHTSFSSVYPQRSPLSLWAHYTRVSIHCFNAGSGGTTFSLWSECVFVSVFVLCESVIRWVKRTWLSSPLCLSLLPWSLTCMPTYTLSLHSLYSTTSSLSVSTLLCTHFWLMESHLLLWQAAYTWLLLLHLMNRWHPHWLFKEKGAGRKREEGTALILGRVRFWTSVLLRVSKGKDRLHACVRVCVVKVGRQIPISIVLILAWLDRLSML